MLKNSSTYSASNDENPLINSQKSLNHIDTKNDDKKAATLNKI